MANKGPLPPNHPFANDDKNIRISDPVSDQFRDTTMMSVLFSAAYGNYSPSFRCVKPLEGSSLRPPKDIGTGDANPRFSGVAVNLDGWPARLTPKQAIYFCDSLHGRLPTPREWAKFAMDNGAQGISDSEKPGYSPIKEQDPRTVAFYMSMEGFTPPQIESPFAVVKEYRWTFFTMPSDTTITQKITGGVRDTWGYYVMSFDYYRKSFLSLHTRPEDAFLTPMCALY